MSRPLSIVLRLGVIASAMAMLFAIGHVHAAAPERPVPVATR